MTYQGVTVSVRLCVCECVQVCVSSRMVTVCHNGRRVGRQRCVHFITAVMTGISSEEEGLPWPRTQINTPPLTPARQFTITVTVDMKDSERDRER